jgi:hypothetical protein
MIPAAIFLFLTGAVLSWRFRVWILVPFGLLAVISAFAIQLALGASIAVAVGHAVLIGSAPQLGYLFGLWAQSALSLRPSERSYSRRQAIVRLYKKASIEHVG